MKSLLLLISSFLISTALSLTFNSTGQFTIVQFTDLHCGSDARLDSQTTELQRKILAWVQPDFVIITGDAAASMPNAPGSFEKTWQKFTAPMLEAQIPYAYTLGNHDMEGDLNNPQIVELDQSNPMSIRKESEGIDGTANFRIPIYASKNESQLAAHLWIFDSGAHDCEGNSDSYGCIEKNVITWYDEESLRIKKQHGENITHLAFYHIPIPEYMEVYNNQEIYGMANERVHCPLVNSGFFEHVRKNGDISSMYVGHDHDNDFGGWYQDVEFVYGRKTGYASYGNKHGARVIVLTEEYDKEGNLMVNREHYVIDENGEIQESDVTRVRGGTKQDSCPNLNADDTFFLWKFFINLIKGIIQWFSCLFN